ncbi:sensor histidine kinase, partial [Cryobacterium melibiosiphilum]
SAGTGRQRAVRRSVIVRPAADGIEVVVRDDGVGFDPRAIARDRAGIAQSIIGRLDRLPGGLATVHSSPGAGTVIAVAWAPTGPIETDAPAAPATEAAVSESLTTRPPAPAVTPASPAPSPTAPTSSAASPAAPSPAPPPTGLLGLSRRSTALILALFLTLHGLFTLTTLGTSRSLPLELVSFALIVVAAAAVVWPAAQPIPLGRTLGILVLCAVTTLIMFVRTDARVFTASAFWHIAAVSVIVLILAARGRSFTAWGGYLALAAATITWAHLHALDPALAVATMVHHAGILVAGTLLVFGLGRMAGTLADLAAKLAARAAAEATLGAAVHERALQLNRVNTLARPALERIARGIRLTDAERTDCLLAEATMRDAIRARRLFVEPVIGAVRAARQRGVEVSLLDDYGDAPGSGPCPDATGCLAALAEIVAAELDATAQGSFTARVLPAGRSDLATIVIDAAEQRMLLIAPDGTVQ